MGTAHEEVAPRPVGTSAADLDVAVIIAITERPERIEEVYEECRAAFRSAPYSPRFVLVGEPWTRHYLEAIRDRREQGEPVRLLISGQAVGETALVRSALAVTEADVVVTLPGYHRVEYSVLPELVERVAVGVDMAVAKRWPRHDSGTNKLQARAFHFLLRRLTGSRLSDVASGVRAMRSSLFEELPVYGDFGRFLPVLASRQGYEVVEVEAEQHERDRGTRVYSPGVYIRRLVDLFGLFFLTRFTEKSLRFFGLLGAAGFGSGALVLAVLVVQRLQGQQLADRPLLLLGLLLVVLGVQAIALGLVGEIIVHLHAARRKPYRLGDLDASRSRDRRDMD